MPRVWLGPILLAGVLALPPAAGAAHAIPCGALTPTLVGTPGNDQLIGGGNGEIIAGMGGDDLLVGGPKDILCGGPGHDSLFVSDGSAYGEEGMDWIRGHGEVTLSGGAADDRITVVRDGVSIAAIDGGQGSDLLAFDYFTGVTANLGKSRATWAEKRGKERVNVARWIDVERLAFEGDGDDVIRGSSGPDFVDTDRGHDRIDGRGGDDILLTDGFRDRVDGGRGFDACQSRHVRSCELAAL